MLKKFAIISAAVVFVCVQSTGAFAKGTTDNGPGCGLGKVAWENYDHPKNILPQLLMSTTNNTILPWQAFGISTGTLGCTNDGIVMAEEKVNVYAAINFENLAQEMAQGRGEHLASLATLMGVPAEHQAEFFAMTQEQYTTLIQSGEATPVALLKALNAAMAGHPVLAQVSTKR